MRSFNEFVQEKEDSYFEEGICELLVPVIEGRLTFDELLENVILPVFEEDSYVSNETEVLNEFLRGMWDRLTGRGQKPQPQPQVNPKHAAAIDHIQKQLQQMIKQDLLPAVSKISNNLKQQAYKTNNKQLYRAADLFADKITKTAQGIKFKVAGSLSGDQRQQFNQDRMASRYTPERASELRNNAQARQDQKFMVQPYGTGEEMNLTQPRSPMTMNDFDWKQQQRINNRRRRNRMPAGSNVVGSVGTPRTSGMSNAQASI